MARRTRVRATCVAVAIAVSCTGFVESVRATDHAGESGRESFVVGPDPLAAVAAAALEAWDSYKALGLSSSFGEFVSLRDEVAAEAALRLGIDPARMQAAWVAADRPHQLAVLAAFTQLGVPYRYLWRKPGEGFDCSGLTSWAWAQAGVTIERASRYQIQNADKVTQGQAQAGDLIYYPTHVMMYLGVDLAIIHTPRTGQVVHLSTVWERKINRLRWGNPLE